MRVPNATHEAHPWRIHELTQGYLLEDVWALPTPGGPGDFPELLRVMASLDPATGPSRATRLLFAIRMGVGDLLGWDHDQGDADRPLGPLADRLPAELRGTADGGPDLSAAGFTGLYLTESEWAAELSNKTVDAALHLAWVADGAGYRGQLAVYARPRGRLGALYMAAITPFRHLIVYPAMMRQIEHAWDARAGRARRLRSP